MFVLFVYTLGLHGTNLPKGCSRNYPQGGGPQALFCPVGGGRFVTCPRGGGGGG